MDQDYVVLCGPSPEGVVYAAPLYDLEQAKEAARNAPSKYPFVEVRELGVRHSHEV